MRGFTGHLRTAFLVCAVLVCSPSGTLAQQPSAPKRVLSFLWSGRDEPVNMREEQEFRNALEEAAPGAIAYYSEYLENDKFPGEQQSQVLRDYLRKKYAKIPIDVVVPQSPAGLDFLTKYRRELFPRTPIVFANAWATPKIGHAGATGIIYASTFRETLDLALRLHPGTRQLLVISGTLNHDKSVESIARDALHDYEPKLPITYLTDLTLEELALRLKTPPQRSIALYVWQQSLNRLGKILETQDVFSLIAREAMVPVYSMSFAYVGRGAIGGYVWTVETNEQKIAELTLRIANGERPEDIPIEKAPAVPMFDWRQLQRWGIGEDMLPPGSVIQFREPTMWQQYKWRIVAGIVVIGLEAFLIGALLVQHYRARRAHLELETHRIHLEQIVQQRTSELVEARDQAVAANRAKSIFLANMSHELRTPLNAILGYSNLLREHGATEEQRRDLDIINHSGEHLLGLIDDVLDVAKIESGSISVESASIDLPALVSDVVNMIREHAQAKNLELRVDISSQTPKFVRTDPGKVRQVLVNLVGNAVKYTDEGSVTVRVDAKAEGTSKDLVVILEVEDTGLGIVPEDQARIFEPFVQAGGARTRKGTGLGLSISRRFVELLGGTIQVESTPGAGSRFRVEVSAQAAEAPEAIPAVNKEEVAGLEPGQPDYRILIVEDQRENWLLLKRLLGGAGFETRVAEDGGQAVEAFREWRPHFIWMDVRLPVLSGLEATKRIREMEGGREVKIAAVTASVSASERESVLAAGLDDFLRKPYRPEEIFECMARHLGVRYVCEAKPEATASNEPAVVRPQDLAALPAALREELERAIISLDREWIGRLVDPVSEQNASLGRVLADLTEAFAYTPILRALQSSKNRLVEASM